MVSIDWTGHNLPHPEKADKGGEDTWFVSENFDFTAAAVFDGVGGWADWGIDPREWAEQMANETIMALDDEIGLISVLNEAYRNTKNKISHGSCTVSIVRHQDGSETLQYANLGDSGLAVYRNGQVFFETLEQTLDFNFPYQLSSEEGENPSDADRGSIPLKSGDFIVLATDGLWDNLYHQEIAKLLQRDDELSEALAIAAYEAAVDPKRWAPFGQKAVIDIYGDREPEDLDYQVTPDLIQYLGGKLDDITVIVGRVY